MVQFYFFVHFSVYINAIQVRFDRRNEWRWHWCTHRAFNRIVHQWHDKSQWMSALYWVIHSDNDNFLPSKCHHRRRRKKKLIFIFPSSQQKSTHQTDFYSRRRIYFFFVCVWQHRNASIHVTKCNISMLELCSERARLPITSPLRTHKYQITLNITLVWVVIVLSTIIAASLRFSVSVCLSGTVILGCHITIRWGQSFWTPTFNAFIPSLHKALATPRWDKSSHVLRVARKVMHQLNITACNKTR